MSNRRKRHTKQKDSSPVVQKKVPPPVFKFGKLLFRLVSGVSVLASLYLTYLAFSASVSISPVTDIVDENQFALPFRVRNSNALPIRQVEAKMVMNYIEDDHGNRFTGNVEHAFLAPKIAAGDYIDHVFEAYRTDTKIIVGEVEVVIEYKLPILPVKYSDKKVFRARRQPEWHSALARLLI